VKVAELQLNNLKGKKLLDRPRCRWCNVYLKNKQDMVMCYRFLLIPDVVQVWAVNITVMNIRAV